MDEPTTHAETGGTTRLGGARLLSINIGVCQPLDVGLASEGLSVESAIRKRSVSSASEGAVVEVKKLGLVGDEQADLSVHGGLDKAVYLYPFEHYAWWRQRRIEADLPDAGEPLAFGMLGENLTTQGLLESDLWVGDTLVIDQVRLRVEAPRSPCFKLNAAMGYRKAVKHMYLSGFAGVYLSVLQTGFIQAGARIEVVPGRREESVSNILDWRRGKARREP
ncbi:MOSC domain-containing protein [Paraburkholderia hospita]|uniref:MOSC domain-containing protein n=1 Tax=Paraburkholderia hospita TaxID=169430 RepID=A0AAN1MNC9_9BURK|nr:MOSC domain-containing protein [Paraburkholderia hospita]AUT73286.1 MOSC domain-containing protein [Paraburkholderia hospita]EIN01093.1 MOSC domain-containing protein [Paraburkholderia hospita]OUL72516.1 sulfurase [Paraburkholderia hospita]OUL88743.1 sulfurase [Paraburkholderia hospita]SEI26815.1 MOSC domain-containing protein YiiM [Paraburkholderia hospita]